MHIPNTITYRYWFKGNTNYLCTISLVFRIKRLHQVGLIEKWLTDYLPKKDRCSNIATTTEVKNHTVNMNDMQGSFFVLFLGKIYIRYDTEKILIKFLNNVPLFSDQCLRQTVLFTIYTLALYCAWINIFTSCKIYPNV